MSSTAIPKILLGKQYMGIEHFSLNSEEWVSTLLVENKKEGLVILKNGLLIQSNTESVKWDTSLPYFIVVNTNQVIQKEILDVSISDEKLLQKAFPNTKWDEFYYEIWRLQSKSIISISRKVYVNDLLSSYSKLGITVAGLSLGVCTISEIINYTQKTAFASNHQLINCDETVPVVAPKSDATEVSYDINGLIVKNQYLLAFAGIVRLLAGSSNTGSSIEYSIALYDNYQQKSLFSKGLKLIIGFLLVVLVVNFFFFTHYYKLAQESSEQLLSSKSSLEEVTRIKQSIALKEQKVKNVIEATSSQSSLFINEIANRIPQSILLSSLVYHPLDKKIKAEEPILAKEKIITVSGTTFDNTAFTHWIESLEKLKWIEQVIIVHFGKNEMNQTEFSIKLSLK